MKTSMFASLSVLLATGTFASPFDDADMFVIGGQDKNGNGYLESGEFFDARHFGSTTATSYMLMQHRRSSPAVAGKASVNLGEVIVGPYQKRLADEPIIHLEPYFDPGDAAQMKNLPTTVELGQKPFSGDKWTLIWRFRPMQYTANNADGYFLNIGNNWANNQGVIFYRRKVDANRDGGVLTFATGNVDSGELTFGESAAPVVFANDHWHEMVVIGDGTTLTVGFRQLGVSPVAFKDAPTAMRWETVALKSSTLTMGNNYLRFGCPYDDWESARRGGFQGDIHLISTWNRALSKDEAEEVLSFGGQSTLAAVGLRESDDVGSVFQGEVGEAAAAGESPSTWRNIPAALTKGVDLDVSFDVPVQQDGRMKMLHLYPADKSGEGTVEVRIDGNAVGTADVIGGQKSTLFVSGSLLPTGMRKLTIVRTDDKASTLSLKGFELQKTGGPLVSHGSVFDDATAIIMAGQDRNGNGFIDEGECVDVRHPGSTLGHSYKVHQFRRTAEMKNSMYFTTDDVRIGSRNVELKDEPVIRMDVAPSGNGWIPNALVFDKGVPFASGNWSVLIRFKPEAYSDQSTDGYFLGVGNDWASSSSINVYLKARRWENLDEHRIDLRSGENVAYEAVPHFNVDAPMWTELAVVADNGKYRLAMRHLRSPGNSGQGGDEVLDRMSFFTWAPGNGTTTPKTPRLNVGCPTDAVQTAAAGSRRGFKGCIHMVGLWDRALSTNEIFEAFSGGRPALLAVGLSKSESVTEVFTNSPGSAVTVTEHPLTWGTLPSALVKDAPVSIRFSVPEWDAGLPQVLRLVPTDDSGAGAVRVALDGISIGDVIAGDGEIGTAYVSGAALTKGVHTLTLTRVDTAASRFVLRGYRLEGSVQVGYANGTPGFTDGEFSYSSHTTVPFMYTLSDGSFRDLSGQAVNNSDMTIRLAFDIPGDLLERGYRFFYETRVVAVGTGGAESGMGYGYQLNDGPTNRLGNAVGANYRVRLDPKLLKPTGNVLKLIDLDETTDYHYTQFDYHRIKVKDSPKGMIMIFR